MLGVSNSQNVPTFRKTRVSSSNNLRRSSQVTNTVTGGTLTHCTEEIADSVHSLGDNKNYFQWKQDKVQA